MAYTDEEEEVGGPIFDIVLAAYIFHFTLMVGMFCDRPNIYFVLKQDLWV